jgi:hypothetical protein
VGDVPKWLSATRLANAPRAWSSGLTCSVRHQAVNSSGSIIARTVDRPNRRIWRSINSTCLSHSSNEAGNTTLSIIIATTRSYFPQSYRDTNAVELLLSNAVSARYILDLKSCDPSFHRIRKSNSISRGRHRSCCRRFVWMPRRLRIEHGELPRARHSPARLRWRPLRYSHGPAREPHSNLSSLTDA